MENTSKDRELSEYTLESKIIFTGFSSFQDAENYAKSNNGKLIEVAFLNGNDNPLITNEGGLLENKNHFLVDAGSEYRFIHSSDEDFREYADYLQDRKANLDKLSPEEYYFANGSEEVAEDPIIVLKNNEFESITSRERSKYLKQAKVYEIAVEISK